MTGSRVYLDHNATTATRPAVISAMAEVLAATGNPSSIHAEGRAKRKLVEAARSRRWSARIPPASPSRAAARKPRTSL